MGHSNSYQYEFLIGEHVLILKLGACETIEVK